jgi:hypothetical protein
MMPARDPDQRDVADVEIGAAATAKRLRFRTKPDTEVRFGGSPEIESDSHTERENLPDEVEPGKTYRDVRVRWIAGARIDDDAVQELEQKIESRARDRAGKDNEES